MGRVSNISSIFFCRDPFYGLNSGVYNPFVYQIEVCILHVARDWYLLT
jgi:hypothetical protein